jgi:cobalamin-dependent methionine synthase I
LPAHELDPHTKYIAAAVCTIGPAVETKCRQLAKQGDFLRSLFLDAAGVALLEALGDRSYEVLSAQAQSRGLFTGCRFGPGYGDMPMSTQSLLFNLANGEKIGVYLNQHMVMKPGKSLSFFVRFTSDETSARNVYKCQACPEKECNFRMVRVPASLTRFPFNTNTSGDLPS